MHLLHADATDSGFGNCNIEKAKYQNTDSFRPLDFVFESQKSNRVMNNDPNDHFAAWNTSTKFFSKTVLD